MAETNPIITMIRQGYKLLGTPYVFGSANPPGGAGGAGATFDCSGLTQFLARKVGVNLTHQAKVQATELKRLGRNELRPGDLVFFSYGRLGSAIDHVGIYIGGGKMIDTSNPTSDLKVADVDWDNFVQGGDMYSAIGRTAKVPSAQRLNALASQFQVDRYVTNSTVGAQSAERAAGKRTSPFSPSWDQSYLRMTLKTYGLDPKEFAGLIQDAVSGGWSLEEFEARVYASKPFRQTFVGIFNDDGSLKMTPLEYQNLIYGPDGYADMAKEYGVKFDRDRFGRLIGGNVSPSEWAYKMNVVQQAQATDTYRTAFNAQLKLAGQKELNPSEWARFIEGKSSKFVEDLYVASSLDANLGLNARGARSLAEQLRTQTFDPTTPGEDYDLGELIAAIRGQQDVFGPELREAGITEADLALMEVGSDPRNLGRTVAQIARNRGALGPGGTFNPATRRPGALAS